MTAKASFAVQKLHLQINQIAGSLQQSVKFRFFEGVGISCGSEPTCSVRWSLNRAGRVEKARVHTHLCNFLLDGRTDGRKVAA